MQMEDNAEADVAKKGGCYPWLAVEARDGHAFQNPLHSYIDACILYTDKKNCNFCLLDSP